MDLQVVATQAVIPNGIGKGNIALKAKGKVGSVGAKGRLGNGVRPGKVAGSRGIPAELVHAMLAIGVVCMPGDQDGVPWGLSEEAHGVGEQVAIAGSLRGTRYKRHLGPKKVLFVSYKDDP